MVGLVDTWAVGHLPSPVHLASVGLGSVIFNYILWAFGFLRMGTTGLVAQARGRKDNQGLLLTVVRSCGLSLGLGVLLVLGQEGLLWASLHIMAPPEEVAAITSEYFRIRIWAAPATLFGYAITGLLFGMAKVRWILWLQLLLNLSNAVLNIIFVVGLDLGVPGVALGTLIAQWMTAMVSVWLLFKLLDRERLVQRVLQQATWKLKAFGELFLVNGLIFVRTILLMTALTLIMRVAGTMGETEMAVSHVIMQFNLLIALGLDGFAHAAEALAGNAWGARQREDFQRWTRLTTWWALLCSLCYALLFWVGGDAITSVLTDIQAVRDQVGALMPIVVLLPIVSVWCYQFDGVFIGATAVKAMLVTMGLAFLLYALLLQPMADRWGLLGLWGAVSIFLLARGVFQAIWYPRLVRQLAN